MALRDHASLVTDRNRNLARTTVINSSQRRTCATMLALTSHYMATNAKHPRYAPGLVARLATQRNRASVLPGARKGLPRIRGLRSVCVRVQRSFGWHSGSHGWVARSGWRTACCRTPRAGRRTQGAGRMTQDAVKPGIHGVGTHWIRGFMAFHGNRRRDPGGGAGELGVAGTG